MTLNDWAKDMEHLKLWGVRGFTLLLLAASFACGGEESEPAAPPAETPATSEATEEAAPAAEEQGEPEVQAEEAGEGEVAVEPEAAELPVVEAPAYASAPTVCEAHPENALEEAVTRRSLSRGEPDFPLVAALNATCEYEPAELAEILNEGGLRRHRQRDYVQSRHYFASAVVLDPSQLSARFNLACAMARQELIDGAVDQLKELQRGGQEGIDYAARAHRDRDFGAYHGTPVLAVLFRDPPPSVEAIEGDDVQVFSEEEPRTYRDTLFNVLGERVWERGQLDTENFPAFVLTMDEDRRRFRYFNDRPTDEVRSALEGIGLNPMLRHAGWTPVDLEERYLVAPVSSRDEDRHTLYVAKVTEDGMLQPLVTRELPAVSCDEGVEAVRTFVESEDHRAFGYVTGCLGAAPHTFDACLYYHKHNEGVLRRCGQMSAATEEAAGEELEEAAPAE